MPRAERSELGRCYVKGFDVFEERCGEEPCLDDVTKVLPGAVRKDGRVAAVRGRISKDVPRSDPKRPWRCTVRVGATFVAELDREGRLASSRGSPLVRAGDGARWSGCELEVDR